jgi:YVTN family beta-propeller protein
MFTAIVALSTGLLFSSAQAAVNGVISTTMVGSGPSAVAVATIGGIDLAYVTNSFDDTVSVINTATRAVVDTIDVGTDPRGVAINDAGTVAYVTNFADDTVTVINTTTRLVTNTISVGDGPWGVDFNRGTSFAVAFVTNSLADTVSLINTNTLADVVAPIAVGDEPRGIVSIPGGGFGLVVSYGSDNLKAISLYSNAVVSTQSTGDGPTSVANVSGGVVVVTNSLENTVSTLNFSSRTNKGSVPVGNDPRAIVVAAGGSRGYVTNYGDGTVTVLTVNSTSSPDKFPTPIAVGPNPVGVALNPGHTRAYVANSGDSSVSEIEILPPYQSFTFSTPANQEGVTGTFTLTNPAATSTANATPTSTGNPVVVSSSTTSVCTVSGRVVTKLMAGTCTLTATAAAATVGAFYYPEKTVGPYSFYIQAPAGAQTVTFPALENVFVGARPTLVATASGTKTFTTQTPSVCTVSGTTLTAVAAGTCTVKVTAAAVTVGPVLYLAGEATTSWEITQALQTITFTSPGTLMSSPATFTVSPTSSAGLPVVVSSSTTSVCTVSGFTVTKVTSGTCTLTATAASGTVSLVSYPAATPVTHSFSIEPTVQTITFTSPGTQVSSVGTFTVTATSSSTLPVVVSSSTTSVCTVSGFTVTKVTTGTCTLTATAASGTVSLVTYPAATPVTHSFSIEDATQTITFTSPGTQVSSVGTLTITATSSAGLPVIVSSSTLSMCTVSGFTVTKVTAGTCTLTANAAAGLDGTTTYSAAAPVTRSFTFQAVSSQLPSEVGSVTPSVPTSETVLLSPSTPTAVVGGLPVTVQVQATNSNALNLVVGNLSLQIRVAATQGSVLSPDGTPQVQVTSGASSRFTGAGLLPQSTVQILMILPNSNARSIARLPVDASGEFSGDAIFRAMGQDRPLPIGRQVMQMVMVNADNQQTVVQVTIDLLQPPPAPQLDRAQGQAPELTLGQLMATNGGEAETVTASANQGQATVVGDGWSMAIQPDGESGDAETSGEGTLLVTLVSDLGTTVSGDGFLPGTRVDVWLFSEPTLLGSVEVDENGDFSGVVSIDGTAVASGEHTLQLQGVGADGYLRTADLGVSVVDEAQAASDWWWVSLAFIGGGLLLAVLLFALWRYRARRQG